MFPPLPFHGRELADLYAVIARSLAAVHLREVLAVVALLAMTAVGLFTLVELMQFPASPRLA
jgi:hypothetical protein